MLIPKNGMRKKPAHRVHTILQIVHRLDIFHTAAQLLSSSVILIFVTIGAIIHSKKLVGLKSRVTSNRALILSHNQSDTIKVSTGVFIAIRIIIENVIRISIRERLLISAHVSAYFHPR